MIDLYKDHVRACIVNFFFKKLPQKLLTGFLPNFTGMVLRVKNSLHRYRKIRPVGLYMGSSTSSIYCIDILWGWEGGEKLTVTQFNA